MDTDDDLPHRKALKAARQVSVQPAGVHLPAEVRDTGDPVAMAREMAALAVETLADVMANGSSDNARLAAATALLDRGYGKPGQSVTVYQGSREMKAAWEYVDVSVERVDDTGDGSGAKTH